MIPKNRIHSSKNAPFKPASLHIHCAQLSNPNPPKPHGCGWRSAHSLGPGIDHLTEHIHPGQNTRLEKAEKAEIGACSHVTCVHPFSLFGNVTCQFQSGSYHWSIHHPTSLDTSDPVSASVFFCFVFVSKGHVIVRTAMEQGQG